MTTVQRGFVIRSHRASAGKFEDEYQKVWAEKGALPEEWNEVKASPDIDQAQIYTNAQSHVRGDKRRILDSK
jgi:hypothetical protein